MRLSNKILLASAAFAVLWSIPPVSAETVTTKTVVHPKTIPDTDKVNFSAFDLNHDNILSMDEVGETLFYVFDTDGNETIDNIEFDHRQVITVIPMEKDTYTFVDWDNDGNVDKSSYTYDTFFQRSGLMRFDKNVNGLSASEFIDHGFLELDEDDSTVIELDEWKLAYEESMRPENAKQERYN